MRVIVSAGGTGGHIYPALAIINKIKEEEPNSEFLYIGTTNRMEKDIVPKYGIKYKGIEVSGFKRKLTLDNFKTLMQYLKARKKCLTIIDKFKPDVVIGAGGYVTGPVIWAAKKLKKKTFIHEQNSVVGLANRYLSKYADRIGVCFESAKLSLPKEKVYLTGNPCSDIARKCKKINIEDYGLENDKKTVLIVMGSLGSRAVNDKIMEFISEFGKKDYQVIFIVGKDYLKNNKVVSVPKNVKLVSYIDNLPGLMKSVDLMISRAGASTISEITAIGVPTIFIPSPYVTNNHQYKNAMDLVNRKAALIIEEKDLNKTNLFKEIDRVLKNSKNYEILKENVRKLAVDNSSDKIYEILKDLILDDKRFF